MCICQNEVFLRNSDLSPQSIELLRNSLKSQFLSNLESRIMKIEELDKESILTLI